MTITIYHNPEMRNVPQHPGNDPQIRGGAAGHRISEDAAEPGGAR